MNELCMGKIPTVITRPSIVVSSQSDPLEGWIDNFYGPMSLLIACGKGMYVYNDDKISYCCQKFVDVNLYIKFHIFRSFKMQLSGYRNSE